MLEMDNKPEEAESESLPTGVFELPGEPAIVINGVPDVSHSAADSNSIVVALSSSASVAESCANINLEAGFVGPAGFGEWLEGREVRKLFGEQYFTGTVTQFDKETCWYRVVYEDGDFEDLDWRELQEVIVPLDISVPLKSLALKVIKKGQKNVHKPVKSATRNRIGKTKSTGTKGNEEDWSTLQNIKSEPKL